MKKNIFIFFTAIICLGCAFHRKTVYYSSIRQADTIYSTRKDIIGKFVTDNVPLGHQRTFFMYSNGQYKDIGVTKMSAIIGEWIKVGDTIKISAKFEVNDDGMSKICELVWPQKLYLKDNNTIVDITNYDSIHRVLKNDPDTLTSSLSDYILWDMLKSQRYKIDSSYKFAEELKKW